MAYEVAYERISTISKYLYIYIYLYICMYICRYIYIHLFVYMYMNIVNILCYRQTQLLIASRYGLFWKN